MRYLPKNINSALPAHTLYRLATLLLLMLGLLKPERTLAQEEQEEIVQSQSLLWKISGNGLKQASYLYGTIHAICLEDIHISEPMQKALQNSRQLALEVDVSNTGELKQMQAGMQMKNRHKLSDYLSTAEYALVARFYLDSLGVNLAELQTMKPIFVSSLLYSSLLDCTVLSYEMQLARIMGMQNKAIVGLENAQEQIRALDAIPYQEQAKLLFEAVKNYETLKADYWNMVVSYKNKDLETLFYIVRQVNLGMKEYEKLLLYDRNRRWMPNLESMARSKATFFAVGAAHLSGEEGLIRLLQRRGYTVEAVAN